MAQSNLAAYSAQVLVATVRAKRVAWLVALGWVAFPFAVATCFHPSDVIRLQAYFEGLPPPHLFTSEQLTAGFIKAVFALGVLILIQLVGTRLFYRYAAITNADRIAAPSLWPIAALLTGIFGNAGWLAYTGQLDPVGGLIGFASMALTVGAEWIIEGMGADFVRGRAQGAHPPINQSW
jgi:hypothetical protein